MTLVAQVYLPLDSYLWLEYAFSYPPLSKNHLQHNKFLMTNVVIYILLMLMLPCSCKQHFVHEQKTTYCLLAPSKCLNYSRPFLQSFIN